MPHRPGVAQAFGSPKITQGSRSSGSLTTRHLETPHISTNPIGFPCWSLRFGQYCDGPHPRDRCTAYTVPRSLTLRTFSLIAHCTFLQNVRHAIVL